MKTACKSFLPRFSFSLLVVAVLMGGGNATAQDQREQAIERLKKISRESVPRVERYLDQISTRVVGPEVPEQMRTDLNAYAGHARKFAACMKLVRIDDFAFKARFDRELREQLFATVDQIAACRVDNLLFAPGTRVMRCCETLDESRLSAAEKELTKPEFDLATDLQAIWRDFDRGLAAETIAEMKRSIKRFERKLIDGFPGMPWEYILNIQGDRRGPSPHQIIWAHFDVGIEQATRVNPGDSRMQPVIALQALGYNYYFLDSENWAGKKLKYIGFAALVTGNARKSVNTARYGGVFHLGNYVSVGSTYGDHQWRLYVSSNKAFDQILKIWN